jgi:CxxC-x17-CxxC domain-containing protein
VRRGRPRRPQRSTFKKKPRQYKVVCSVCGAEIMVPVAPPADKELTCLRCLQVKREHNQGNESGRQGLLREGRSATYEMLGKSFNTRRGSQ